MLYATKDKTHSLTIKNAQLNARGVYSVKATNQAGEITASARLTVNGNQFKYIVLIILHASKAPVESQRQYTSLFKSLKYYTPTIIYFLAP